MSLKQLEEALKNPNAQKYLRMIAMAEGTYKGAKSNPYVVGFGNTRLPHLNAHPGTSLRREFTQTDGKKNTSTAAGAYQFMPKTWNGIAKQLGLKDFSPRSQDIGALHLIREKGALNDVLSGRFDSAVQKTGRVWASLPSSPYAQPKRSMGFIERALNTVIPAANAQELPQEKRGARQATGIDLSKAKWDQPSKQQSRGSRQAAPGEIDLSKVKWDSPAAQVGVGQAASVLAAGAAGGAKPGQQPQQPQQPRSMVQKIGDAIMEAPRQLGLTARYGLEGMAGAAEIVTEPIRYVTDRLSGQTGKTVPLSTLASRGADALGLPKPQNSTERVVGDAARLMAGSAGLMGAGNLAGRGSGEAARTVGQFLTANPTAQLTSAAGSGVAGGSVRESGGGATEQTMAAVLGGFAGAGVPSLVNRAANAAKAVPDTLANLANPGRQTAMAQQIDVRIHRALNNAGVDWNAIPERVRQAVRQDVARALRVGDDLNPEALQRLVDFRSVGATPTRGTVTLDPRQITLERNLAKAGANSGNQSAQQLVDIEANNNRALLRGITDMGADAGADQFAMGQRGIDSLGGWLQRARGRVNDLYAAARGNSGRGVPLDGAFFTKQASQLLDDNLLGHALPKDVQTHLNRIAMGEVPFDVNYAEQLKTVIGKLQRGTSDGSTRMALGMVRQALDDVPMAPGAATALGDDAVAAFNQARQANRQMMQRIERVPALQRLWRGDITPDDFMRRYVISQNAKARDVAGMIRAMDQDGRAAMRSGVLAHLKQAATGGAADETAKFSASGFHKALDNLGDRKLRLLFTRDEISSLRALSRVAGYTTHQPVGSAVNNSNSGAMLVGKGLDLLNGMGRLGDLVRVAGIGEQLNVAVRAGQQSHALNAAGGVVRRGGQAAAQPGTLRQLALPTGRSSALFGAPFTPKGDENE